MSNIMIKDLNESTSMDRAAMSSVRGGLTIGAMVFGAHQNQTIGGSGYNVGDVNAVNAPNFSPVTNIAESNPLTYTGIDVANLNGVANSGVAFQ